MFVGRIVRSGAAFSQDLRIQRAAEYEASSHTQLEGEWVAQAVGR